MGMAVACPDSSVAPRSPAYGTRDVVEVIQTGATDISIPSFAPSFTDSEHMDYLFFLPLTTDMECLTHLGREHVSRFRTYILTMSFFTAPCIRTLRAWTDDGWNLHIPTDTEI